MSRPVADLVIEHALVAVTCAGPAPRDGSTPGALGLVEAPAVASSGGRLLYAGPAATLDDHVATRRGTLRINARGCSLLPGFVDAVAGVTTAVADWTLAHGATTLLDTDPAAARRPGCAVVAPVDWLAALDGREEERPAAGSRPRVLTAVAGAGAYVASTPYALMVACLGQGLSLAEAVVAATINAAWSLGCDGDRGSLEPGKRTDVTVVKGRPGELLRAGAGAVRMVIRDGKLVAWV